MAFSGLAVDGVCAAGSKASGKMAIMARMPKRANGSKRKLVMDYREMPKRFNSRASEARFWESRDFAPGVLVEGKSVYRELDELLGVKEK